MALWQEILLAIVSGLIGMLFSALLLVWKYGPKITNLDFRLAHVERTIERIELRLLAINLAEFENRILERMDGRYMKVGHGDEKWGTLKERLDRCEADIELMRSH